MYYEMVCWCGVASCLVLRCLFCNDCVVGHVWSCQVMSCHVHPHILSSVDPQDSFVYKLSTQKGLEYFENVFLLASQQDKYAPFHSARIQSHKLALQDKKRGMLWNSAWYVMTDIMYICDVIM